MTKRLSKHTKRNHKDYRGGIRKPQKKRFTKKAGTYQPVKWNSRFALEKIQSLKGRVGRWDHYNN